MSYPRDYQPYQKPRVGHNVIQIKYGDRLSPSGSSLYQNHGSGAKVLVVYALAVKNSTRNEKYLAHN